MSVTPVRTKTFPTLPYAVKAYGTWDAFATEKDYRAYLAEWIASTDGAERDRAVDAQVALSDGHTIYDSDSGLSYKPKAPVPAPKDSDAGKIEKVKGIIRMYFENDPWTEEPSETFDDMLTAQEAIDRIVEVLS